MKAVRGALSSALEEISRLEVGAEAGPACTKTRSVDQILEQRRSESRSQFHSVDNMSQLSSTSTGPRPDISGERPRSVLLNDLVCEIMKCWL